MLCPCPDDHVYIIHAENLRKHSNTGAFRSRLQRNHQQCHNCGDRENVSEPLLQIR